MKKLTKARKAAKKQYDYRTTLSFIASFTIGIALILLTCFLDKYVDVAHFKIFIWNVPKYIVIDILSQFAGTFFVIAILIVTVEKIFKLFLKKDIDAYTIQISQSVHDAIYKNFIPEEILSEIKQQIFLSAFVYENYNIEYIAEGIVDVGGEKCIKFSSEVIMTIKNISELKRKYTGVLEYTNAEFENFGAPIKHESLEISYKNEPILKFNAGECERRVSNSGDGGKYLFPYEVEIPGDDEVEIRLNRTILLKDKGDSINLFVKRPLINMNMKIVFPTNKYKLFYYPNLPDLGGDRKSYFEKKVRHHGKDITLNYKGGMLPYQGIMIEWKKISS